MSEPTTTRSGRVDQRIELRRKEALAQRAAELMRRTGNVVDRHPFAIVFGPAYLVLILLYLIMAPGRLGWIPYSPMGLALGGGGMMALVVGVGYAYRHRRLNWYIRKVLEENPCVYCGQSLRGVPAGPDKKVVCAECGHCD